MAKVPAAKRPRTLVPPMRRSPRWNVGSPGVPTWALLMQGMGMSRLEASAQSLVQPSTSRGSPPACTEGSIMRHDQRLVHDDSHVGPIAGFVKRLECADLIGAERTAALQDERNLARQCRGIDAFARHRVSYRIIPHRRSEVIIDASSRCW